MKFISAILVAAVCLATPAAASGTLYDCTVKQRSGPDGWVSPRTALILDEQGGGQIIDSLTLYFKTGPKPARVRKQGDKLLLNWSFSALNVSAAQTVPQFSFRATLNTRTGAFKVRGRPAHFPESVSGAGTCTPRKNLSDRELNRLLKS